MIIIISFIVTIIKFIKNESNRKNKSMYFLFKNLAQGFKKNKPEGNFASSLNGM